jgi:PTS system nitrogen regulatory IIA component
MRLTDILSVERIVPALQAKEREEVLRELVLRGLLREGQTRGLDEDDEDRIIQVLLERERLGSTGIKDGLAIPHGKLGGLGSLTACVGLSKKGVDFGAMDGEPSRVFIVLLSPEQNSGDHLKALARISRLFSGGNLTKRLMELDQAQGIFDLLAGEDARL